MNPKANALGGDVMIGIGDLDLAALGDLRAGRGLAAIPGDAWQSLLKTAASNTGRLVDRLGELAAKYPASHDYLAALKSAVGNLDREIALTYPFTDDPVNGAFALLLGRDADLVRFTVNLPGLLGVNV